MNQLSMLEGIRNIISIVEILSTHVSTDMPMKVMLDVARDFTFVSSDDVHTIPMDAHWDSSISFTVINKEELQRVRQLLKELLAKSSPTANRITL